MHSQLSPETLQRLLSRRDLTDPRQGRHALQTLYRQACASVSAALSLPLRLHRTSGILSGSAPRLQGGATEALEELLQLLDDEGNRAEHLFACLGPVYGREQDGAVRLSGHRLALWVRDPRTDSLPPLVKALSGAALPETGGRLLPEPSADFDRGFRLDVRGADGWDRMAMCGYAHLDGQPYAGVLLDLERALATRKGLPDVRLVHDPDPDVQGRMLDLEPWTDPREQEQPVRRRLQPTG
ncbi:MAG: hypothetical protein JJT90_07670 [Ectothiorhodospiraceae bacterium]|nr:hypothetical protein [Ectothiorhodospiraceae bacterium]